MRTPAIIGAALAVITSAAGALELPANARMTAERLSPQDSYAAPVSPFADGAVDRLVVEGLIRRQSWRIASPGLTPLQVLAPLRTQLQDAGYKVLLDCADEVCGGFDFRFGTEVLPAPNMYVNIADYRFLTAILGPETAPETLTTLMLSSTRDAAYVQVIEVHTSGEKPAPTQSNTEQHSANANPEDASSLVTAGRFVLNGVTFKTGSTDLSEETFPAIAALAEYLIAEPGINIALVGHTDSVGALDGNIAISKRRAQAVRKRLVEKYGVPEKRMQAEGMGYLAPRASNLTEAGRTANRRVEAIALGTKQE